MCIKACITIDCFIWTRGEKVLFNITGHRANYWFRPSIVCIFASVACYPLNLQGSRNSCFVHSWSKVTTHFSDCCLLSFLSLESWSARSPQIPTGLIIFKIRSADQDINLHFKSRLIWREQKSSSLFFFHKIMTTNMNALKKNLPLKMLVTAPSNI